MTYPNIIHLSSSKKYASKIKTSKKSSSKCQGQKKKERKKKRDRVDRATTCS